MTTCYNGQQCALPSGADPTKYKCPEGQITGSCTNCENINSEFECTYTYADGTVKTENFNPSNINYDYMGEEDLPRLANLYEKDGETKIKCCYGDLGDDSVEPIIPSSLRMPVQKGGKPKESIPLLFSGQGNPYEDCGFYIDPNELNTFCGVELKNPVEVYDYDVICIKK
ncbi:MAG: hypothetical protein PHU63_03860 [Candidatus ainarchaeum sp.]|nr:hypothetical protein [Candidatus ainarchaeum sp.]